MTQVNDEVRQIIDEAARADGTPPVSDQALLAAAQGDRSLLRFEEAFGIVGEGELDLVVRPSARGRGIGSAAMQALLREAQESSPGELRAWAHGENPAARALLSASGFTPVRTLLRMTLDPALLPSAIKQSRPFPAGFTIRHFDPEKLEHATEWVRVNAAAFADHPEQGSVTLRDFQALTKEPWFAAEDLRLAFVSGPTAASADQLAGFTWIKTLTEAGTTETELYVVGVDPAHAGKGLGAALTGETLRRMQEHEPDRITLYVDGDNESARALYDRAGFTIEQRSTQYLRNVE